MKVILLHSPILAINTLIAELNPIRHLLALAGLHHFVHVSRIRVKETGLSLLTSLTPASIECEP
jgi:hypothetical protein